MQLTAPCTSLICVALSRIPLAFFSLALLLGFHFRCCLVGTTLRHFLLSRAHCSIAGGDLSLLLLSRSCCLLTHAIRFPVVSVCPCRTFARVVYSCCLLALIFCSLLPLTPGSRVSLIFSLRIPLASLLKPPPTVLHITLLTLEHPSRTSRPLDSHAVDAVANPPTHINLRCKLVFYVATFLPTTSHRFMFFSQALLR